MPFDDDDFDVSFAVCVFHHILPEHRETVVSEMQRVTKPGGLVLIFEHNPFNCFTQIAVKRCSLDADAILLRAAESRSLLEGAGLDVAEQRYILLTPWEWSLMERAEKALWGFPFGAQYYAMGRCKES